MALKVTLVEWRAYLLHCERGFRRWSAAGAVSWQGWVSLLPAFAVINTTLALFYLDHRRLRIALLASSVAWIANDLYWQAWPALLAETVAVGLNVKMIWRMAEWKVVPQ